MTNNNNKKNKKPLHIPRRSRHVAASAWVDYPGPIPAGWHVVAKAKTVRCGCSRDIPFVDYSLSLSAS